MVCHVMVMALRKVYWHMSDKHHPKAAGWGIPRKFLKTRVCAGLALEEVAETGDIPCLLSTPGKDNLPPAD